MLVTIVKHTYCPESPRQFAFSLRSRYLGCLTFAVSFSSCLLFTMRQMAPSDRMRDKKEADASLVLVLSWLFGARERRAARSERDKRLQPFPQGVEGHLPWERSTPPPKCPPDGGLQKKSPLVRESWPARPFIAALLETRPEAA